MINVVKRAGIFLGMFSFVSAFGAVENPASRVLALLREPGSNEQKLSDVYPLIKDKTSEFGAADIRQFTRELKGLDATLAADFAALFFMEDIQGIVNSRIRRDFEYPPFLQMVKKVLARSPVSASATFVKNAAEATSRFSNVGVGEVGDSLIQTIARRVLASANSSLDMFHALSDEPQTLKKLLTYQGVGSIGRRGSEEKFDLDVSLSEKLSREFGAELAKDPHSAIKIGSDFTYSALVQIMPKSFFDLLGTTLPARFLNFMTGKNDGAIDAKTRGQMLPYFEDIYHWRDRDRLFELYEGAEGLKNLISDFKAYLPSRPVQAAAKFASVLVSHSPSVDLVEAIAKELSTRSAVEWTANDAEFSEQLVVHYYVHKNSWKEVQALAARFPEATLEHPSLLIKFLRLTLLTSRDQPLDGETLRQVRALLAEGDLRAQNRNGGYDPLYNQAFVLVAKEASRTGDVGLQQQVLKLLSSHDPGHSTLVSDLPQLPNDPWIVAHKNQALAHVAKTPLTFQRVVERFGKFFQQEGCWSCDFGPFLDQTADGFFQSLLKAAGKDNTRPKMEGFMEFVETHDKLDWFLRTTHSSVELAVEVLKRTIALSEAAGIRSMVTQRIDAVLRAEKRDNTIESYGAFLDSVREKIFENSPAAKTESSIDEVTLAYCSRLATGRPN